MAATLSTAARNSRMDGLNTAIGASGKAKLYNGSKPASLGAPAGTLLATLVGGSSFFSNASGVGTFSIYTQTNSSHVTGTPTFVRITTSADVVVADIDIGAGAGNITFTGTVTNGQNITGSFTVTDGNA